jgi:hypothetical protein
VGPFGNAWTKTQEPGTRRAKKQKKAFKKVR